MTGTLKKFTPQFIETAIWGEEGVFGARWVRFRGNYLKAHTIPRSSDTQALRLQSPKPKGPKWGN